MTHNAHDDQTEAAGQAPRSTAVKRARKALSLSVSIFTPINDMRRMGSDVSQSVKTSISRLKAFRRQVREEKREKLTFEQAVQASGYSLPQLLWKYRFLKRLWWVVAGLFLVLTPVLMSMILLTASTLPPMTFWRAIIFVVIFAALASLAALKVVICQYRLWQLQQRRVSDEEGGRFSDFLHHAHWIKDALNPV
ncbi:conjugal transfer protein TraX [Klebsiella pneumoniae]|uniref:conjugal transfer protein TraX n=1 Tax=Klebsiella pneumoniae TaxID=573 RepID=UPI0029621EDB|nr:conjugal transfer protein TraX [Klebsiella pneumoniae]MDW1257216.1 conjugal transfer protein TraX [Klebsiella pneumoniae]